MDDLDALLADLQNTTSQVNQYQPHAASTHHQQHEYTTHSVNYGSQRNRSETPPPLPPPPPQELLDGIPPPKQFEESMYESQHDVKRQTSSSSTSHSSDPLSFHDKSPSSPPLQQQQQQQQPRQMSALSNNLSELDQLLQDLNSAQFMAEVDKRNVHSTQSQQHQVINGGGGEKVPPPVAPKPSRTEHRSSVDGLLDMLEGSVPDSPSNYRSPPPPSNDNYEYTSPAPVPQQYSYTQTQNQRVQEVSRPPAASTATRELDELMATLSEFKVSGNQPQGRIQQIPVQPPRSPSPSSEPPYARPVKSRNSSQSGVSQPQPQSQRQELESMLGNLQEDMKSQGVTTKTKGLCGACNQPVVGQVITALGKVWHIEHFVCANCSLPLGTKNFYERDGAAYCEEDYHRIFAPKCAYCNGPIVDKCVTALDMTWHPEHFFCAQCGRPFGEEGFHEKDGKAYCRDDYLEMFAPRCGGCGTPILDNYISALSRHWHPECFVCRECRMPFGGRSFFEHEGQPYCETHYHLKRGSLCASCQKPITGRCITAMYKKFHPEHFVCAFCLKQLNKGTFKEQNDKPYCHPCFVKLFG